MQYRLKVYQGKWNIVWHDNGTKRHSTGIEGSQENYGAAETQRQGFLANLRQSRPAGTVTVDRCLSGYFEAKPQVYPRPSLLSFFAHMLPEHIDENLCKDYAEKRAEKGIRPATIYDELGILRTSLTWAERQKWIGKAPWIWRPAAPAPRDRWLSTEEASRLIEAAKLPHVRLFILMALHTTARAGAILDLTWDRVMFDLNRISFERPGKATGKKRRATVRMSPEIRQALQAAKSDALNPIDGPVIEYAGRAVKSVKHGFRDAVARAGLKDVTPHVLRHTAATWMRRRKVSSEEIAGMLGNSVRMVERVYAKHDPDYQKAGSKAISDALRSAPPVQGEPVCVNERRTSSKKARIRVRKIQ